MQDELVGRVAAGAAYDDDDYYGVQRDEWALRSTGRHMRRVSWFSWNNKFAPQGAAARVRDTHRA